MDAAGVRRTLYSGSSSTFEFGSSLMLPEGNTTLYICVSDTDGGQACESDIVTVVPAKNFRLSDAVSQFDVEHMTGTNDIAVLAAGAAALQSMNNYAQQQVASTAAGTSGNDTSSAEDQQKLQQAIDTKAGALINTLAKSAGDLVGDPQSMQQVWPSHLVCLVC